MKRSLDCKIRERCEKNPLAAALVQTIYLLKGYYNASRPEHQHQLSANSFCGWMEEGWFVGFVSTVRLNSPKITEFVQKPCVIISWNTWLSRLSWLVIRQAEKQEAMYKKLHHTSLTLTHFLLTDNFFQFASSCSILIESQKKLTNHVGTTCCFDYSNNSCLHSRIFSFIIRKQIRS